MGLKPECLLPSKSPAKAGGNLKDGGAQGQLLVTVLLRSTITAICCEQFLQIFQLGDSSFLEAHLDHLL